MVVFSIFTVAQWASEQLSILGRDWMGRFAIETAGTMANGPPGTSMGSPKLYTLYRDQLLMPSFSDRALL